MDSKKNHSLFVKKKCIYIIGREGKKMMTDRNNLTDIIGREKRKLWRIGKKNGNRFFAFQHEGELPESSLTFGQ